MVVCRKRTRWLNLPRLLLSFCFSPPPTCVSRRSSRSRHENAFSFALYYYYYYYSLSLSLSPFYSFYTRYNFLRERTIRFSLLRRALITYLDAAGEKLRRSTYVPKSLCGAPVKKTIQLCRSIVNAARRGSFLDDV